MPQPTSPPLSELVLFIFFTSFFFLRIYISRRDIFLNIPVFISASDVGSFVWGRPSRGVNTFNLQFNYTAYLQADTTVQLLTFDLGVVFCLITTQNIRNHLYLCYYVCSSRCLYLFTCIPSQQVHKICLFFFNI